MMHCIFTFNFVLLYICRRHYGLSVPLSWADLSQTHPAEVVEALQKVYTQVTDIELYPGGELIAYNCIKSQLIFPQQNGLSLIKQLQRIYKAHDRNFR